MKLDFEKRYSQYLLQLKNNYSIGGELIRDTNKFLNYIENFSTDSGNANNFRDIQDIESEDFRKTKYFLIKYGNHSIKTIVSSYLRYTNENIKKFYDEDVKKKLIKAVMRYLDRHHVELFLSIPIKVDIKVKKVYVFMQDDKVSFILVYDNKDRRGWFKSYKVKSEEHLQRFVNCYERFYKNIGVEVIIKRF